MGFRVLTVDKQCSLTHVLLNTNQNAVRGSPEDHFKRIFFDPNKKDNKDTSLAPVETEIKFH